MWHSFTRLVAAHLVIGVSCMPFCNLAKAQSAVPEVRPGVLAGYLSPELLPDSLALLPPPPATGSAALTLDEEISRKSRELRGTARWTQAAEDANFMFPRAAGTFSCALNAPITEQDTPHLYTLMRRTPADVGFSTYPAKNHYNRLRPFVLNHEPICQTGDEKYLVGDGSYPSGHAALGWAWALILVEIAPERTDAILARGRAFGQSRVVCNVHWQSDVIEGRVWGASIVARLHADAAFLVDLEAAKPEMAAVRAKGLTPNRDCAAEAQAIALDPPLAP
jgi:acid phosphatase (class A)